MQRLPLRNLPYLEKYLDYEATKIQSLLLQMGLEDIEVSINSKYTLTHNSMYVVKLPTSNYGVMMFNGPGAKIKCLKKLFDSKNFKYKNVAENTICLYENPRRFYSLISI